MSGAVGDKRETMSMRQQLRVMKDTMRREVVTEHEGEVTIE